jgi:hypothetical protein
MKLRKVIVTKEVWTTWSLKEINDFEEKTLSEYINRVYHVKQVKINIVKPEKVKK